MQGGDGGPIKDVETQTSTFTNLVRCLVSTRGLCRDTGFRRKLSHIS